MKPLSASQAVWPAAERTYQYLFRPFAWETFLKLAAVAAITEGVVVSFRFTVSNEFPADSGAIEFSSIRAAPGFIFFAVLAVAGALLIGLFIFALITQLRFAFFHCLVFQTTEIRPAGKLYRTQTERFFKASLLVWLALFVLAMLPAAGLVITAFVVLTARTQEGLLDPGIFLILFLPCVGIALVVGLVAAAAEVVLHDFILPHMALGNARFREAWAAVRLAIRADRQTFLSYFILRLALPLVAGFGLALAAWLPLLLVFWILSTSAAGFHNMLEDATGLGAFFRVALEILFALIGLVLGLFVAFTLGGPLATWIRNYALLFYGGRYPALGNTLDLPPPATPGAPEGA